MAAQMSTQHPPSYTTSQQPRREQEDWEEWEDDDIFTPIDAGEQVSIAAPPPSTTQHRNVRQPSSRASRVSGVRAKRPKSRYRQKTQNAKAGIRLITDMTAFRRQAPALQQLRSPDGQRTKFVDAAALRALEGDPSSASVGNWNWFKKEKTHSPATASPQQPAVSPSQQLSPEDRPIVIGISLSSDKYDGRDLSPPTATPFTLQTSLNPQPTLTIPQIPSTQSHKATPTPSVQKSVWSPDTPDTATSWRSSRVASSIYSKAPSPAIGQSRQVPPVPKLPTGYKKTHHQRLISLEIGNNPDEDDTGTPCTPFEEDGMPSPLKITKGKNLALTPDSAASNSHGWWDHVITPFTDKRLTFTRKQRVESPKEEQGNEWWANPVPNPTTTHCATPKHIPASFEVPIIVKPPTPRRTLSNRSDNTAVGDSGPSTGKSSPTLYGSPVREKPKIIITSDIPSDQPPPYSPPKKNIDPLVRYRAVFPPGHPLQAQFPPSPGPISPGLSATMTSQGATHMTDIPLTPSNQTRSPPSQAPLPSRPPGTFLPQAHSQESLGEMTSSERERRRHEKEEVVARKLGGFWRGRGCVPESGCFGRSGREGRKRRRICIILLILLLLLIILAIVLGVVLTRPHKVKEIPSIWVNLTDYPPMPTGVLTVVGPDNTFARDGCTEPSTMWSCSLPKEQHDSVAPYKSNQPTVIMNIQWDNNTRETWKVPNGDPPPPPVSRRNVGGAVGAGNALRERQTSDFNPNPSPPDFQEMWFLGNTTDGIESDDKAGEPTPFYISLLDSLESEDSKQRKKRQTSNVSLPDILPSPDLKEDGTPKPAVLLPQPFQQPVRLYDRGLPTEHYGFYTYFKRTIYLKSVTVLNGTNDDDIPLDEDGGCRETEANFLATWGETRLLVQIWTKTLDGNSSSLLRADGLGSIDDNKELIRPGTMPYPVTVTVDTHGGNPIKKFVWNWPIDDRQQLDVDNPKLLSNDIGYGGTWINRRSRGDEKYGGFDGGTGGCKCQWVNWV